jgi:hypothetical protein
MKIVCIIVITLILFSYFFVDVGFAAFESEDVSARVFGMGNAFVAVANDANTVFRNPAGLDNLYGMHVTTGYTSLFGMEELTSASATYAIATNLGGFGINFSNFGDEVYGERTGRFSYGKRVYDRILVGTSVKWHQLEIQNYGSKSVFSFDLALLAFADEKLRIGAFAENLNTPSLTGSDTDKIQQSLTIGAAYLPTEKFTFALDIYKEPNFQKEYRVGAEYQPISYITLRCGVQTEPSRYSAGATVSYSFINFDYAFANHTTLGGTHYFSLSLKWSD